MQNWDVCFKPWLRHAPPGLTHPKIKWCLLTPCQRYCLVSANLQGYLQVTPSEIPLEPMKLFTPHEAGPSWCSKTNTVFLKNISDRHKVCCNLLSALPLVPTTTQHCFFLMSFTMNQHQPSLHPISLPWLQSKQSSHTLYRKRSALSLWKYLDTFLWFLHNTR